MTEPTPTITAPAENTALRVLNVEDNENDSMLIIHELRRGGFDLTCQRVETEPALRAALRDCPWELIISDFALPTLRAPDVLRIVQEEVGDRIPFIVISGTVSEETAVTLMRSGAADYLSKDSLTRLVPAVRRELAEAEQHRRRKAAETQARLSALLLDSAADAIVADTVDGPIHYANRAAVEAFGLGSPDQGLQLRSVVAPEVLPAWDRWYALLGHDNVIRFESCLRRRSGTTVPVEVTARLVEVDGTTFVLSSFRDLTERHRAERELRDTEVQLHQAQKMEAIGTLAGGIAHDFNNLLGAIVGHAEFALDEIPPGHPGHDDIEQINAVAQRAAALTSQLLAFGRRQILRIASLDLNRVVSETEKMLHRVIGEDIRLQCRLAPDLQPVRADQSRLEQIIMNLAVNARDAMPAGGTITVETRAVHVAVDEVYRDGTMSTGDYVELVVADTGTGMDDATLKRIFEPFFTTKPVGKGTGLGLSTVYGIVKQFDGHITVESEPGKGTTFRILLPAGNLSQPALVQVEPTRSGTSAPHPDATILLVEDDERLRTVVERALRKRGYTVLSADGGEAALRLFEAPGAKVDLLLTDVVMPRMSGALLADELRRRRPGLKVIYTSGYTDNAIVHHGVLQPDTIFIQKPFRIADLVSLLQDVLR